MTKTQATTTQDGLMDALVQSAFTVVALLNRAGAEHDLSLTQLRVMAILRDRRLRVTTLADYLGLEKSTMSGLVDRAARRGLLERGANAADGRAVDVFLTAGGSDLADRVHVEIAQSLAPLTGELTAADARRLQTLLEKLLDARERRL